jgi:hypothetical protein
MQAFCTTRLVVGVAIGLAMAGTILVANEVF